MGTYNLVNPKIIGSMKTKFTASTSLKAADDAFKTLSQYFGNHMPEFNFTLEEGNGKLLHFKANETVDGEGKNAKVSYKIKRFSFEEDKKVVDSFQSRLKKVEKHDGGGRYVSGPIDYYDDDMSDYFYDYERPRTGPLVYNPISYYWYNPYIYPLSDRWYVPTFVLPIQPRVVIDSHSLLYL